LRDVHVDGVHEILLRADGDGYRPKSELFVDWLEYLPWISAPSVRELENYWQHQFPRSTVERTGAKALLQDLRAAGIHLGLVTNGSTQTQTTKIESLGFTSL